MKTRGQKNIDARTASTMEDNYYDDDYDYDYDYEYEYPDDANYTYNNYTYNYTIDTLRPEFHDYSRGDQIYKWILVAAVIPVCIVGLAGNTVSVWAWNANRKHNSVVLLFQCLGLVDNAFLLVSAVRAGLYYKNQLTRAIDAYLFPILYLFQTLSVSITLIIGVFRWLAVARPQLGQRVTRGHVVMTCGAVGVWCILLSALVIVMKAMFKPHTEDYVLMDVVLHLVGLVLPNLVLLAFSINLLRITFMHQRHQTKNKHRRTTVAVLSIAGCSFLACPVAVTAHLLHAIFKDKRGSWCNWTCVFAATGAGDLLQVANSSVNFLFYFFFASRFRPLLQHAMRSSLFRRKVRGRKSSTTSSVLHPTSDSGSSTYTSSICRQESKEEPLQEPTKATTCV
ncbi:uncharacterized protein LOC143288441 [Babylonia areolata]|uniref:uncharacterized protein LOC143288441 n=1 Tax=Babylonia areolata TaxID=304850 RepID=UPI003FD44355